MIDDPRATCFKLVQGFVQSLDRINYYNVIRRLAIYLLQTVEGFKRATVDFDGSESRRDGFDYSTVRMSAALFDRILAEAYVTWLTNPDESSERYVGLLDSSR